MGIIACFYQNSSEEYEGLDTQTLPQKFEEEKDAHYDFVKLFQHDKKHHRQLKNGQKMGNDECAAIILESTRVWGGKKKKTFQYGCVEMPHEPYIQIRFSAITGDSAT